MEIHHRRTRAAVLACAAFVIVASALTGCSAVMVAVAGAVGREAQASQAGEGDLEAAELVVGDCFDAPEDDADEIWTVSSVPCDEPHLYEVFHDFVLPEGPFPGEDELWDIADDTCLERFEEFVGESWAESALDYSSYTPSKQGWTSRDDRLVTCFLWHPDELLTGSAAGSGRQSS